jgi:hypothetical protein
MQKQRQMRYTLSDFKNYQERMDNFELSESVIKIINELAQHVGAPEYRKTPVFKKHDRKNREMKTISTEDWEKMRNFKRTNIKKNTEGIETNINELRMMLNKLTQKNYDELLNKIKMMLNNLIESKASEEDLLKVSKSIFEIGCMNKFWSKLYAKLYKDLIRDFPLMNEIYKKSFKSFINVFENIRTVDNNDDYELLCEINKENTKRKSLSSFFVHLMNESVIDSKTIGDIINLLIVKFNDLMNGKENKLIIDEITENLFILINESKETLSKDYEKFDKIIEFIDFVINCDYKNIGGISSKTVFKFLDLRDD